jgi:hypothetical protein
MTVSIIADQTTHNNKPDIAILNKCTKEAHSTAVATPSSHKLHNTVTEKHQKYTGL